MRSGARAQRVGVRYEVPMRGEGWELEAGMLPESVPHDLAVELLKAVLVAWAARKNANAGAGAMFVARNLATRWDAERPEIGVDPDVSVLSPPPPDVATLVSVQTWLAGHAAPVLAVEVVRECDPRKDYTIVPDKYAASGTRELWIFDPFLAAPPSHAGPFRIQVWSRSANGDFIRVYAGDGPAYSEAVHAYLVATGDGHLLRIADDADAPLTVWPTQEESHRAERDAARAERAERDAERAAKEAALARVAELEARLARGGNHG